MSPRGTAAYDGLTGLPPLVEQAVALARREGFDNSCRPEHGRLLLALAAGADLIGETGTACGVGLAWLASGARPGTRLISAEIDAARASKTAALFAELPQVTVLPGDWSLILEGAPFDLLVLDGGAPAKFSALGAPPARTEPPAPGALAIENLLRPGGTLIIDDLTPAQEWPPRFAGQVDASRMHWLTHPDLDAAELRLAPDLAALVATRRYPPA